MHSYILFHIPKACGKWTESLIFRRGRKKPSKSEWQRDQEWAREDDTQGNNHPDLGRENFEGKRKLSLGNFPVHLPLKWRLEQIPHLDLSSLNCRFESLWCLTAQAHPSLTTLGSPSFREAATQQAVPLHTSHPASSCPSKIYYLPFEPESVFQSRNSPCYLMLWNPGSETNICLCRAKRTWLGNVASLTLWPKRSGNAAWWQCCAMR